jgi:hypothetical protein
VKVVKFDKDSKDDGTSEAKTEDRELVMDRKSEFDTAKQRTIREDVVTRYWGSEAELTKDAYDEVNRYDLELEEPITIEGEGDGYPYTISTRDQLKNKIIELKLENNSDKQSELQKLLGSLVNQVVFVKEQLVMKKMDEMHTLATSEIEKKDNSANAKVVDFS